MSVKLINNYRPFFLSLALSLYLPIHPLCFICDDMRIYHSKKSYPKCLIGISLLWEPRKLGSTWIVLFFTTNRYFVLLISFIYTFFTWEHRNFVKRFNVLNISDLKLKNILEIFSKWQNLDYFSKMFLRNWLFKP